MSNTRNSSDAELAALDATAQADLVRLGNLSARELIESAIRRAEALQPILNCFTTTRFTAALSEADAAVAAPAADAPFAGVPTAMKDLTMEIAGEPCHMGSRAARSLNTLGSTSSYHYQSFRKAGLISLGRTNTPEFGTTITTEPLSYGPARNPWNTNHSTGGSSGGAAAAVAAGIVPVAHATDGGGSIRIPASECGLVGLKPSRGRISHGPGAGEGWAGSTVGHVVTRSVRDSAALLDSCAGYRPGDPYTAPPHIRPYTDELGADPGRLQVGFCAQPTVDGHVVHPECVRAVDDAAHLLEQLGHHVAEACPAALLEQSYGRNFMTIVAAGTTHDVQQLETALGRSAGIDDVEEENLLFSELGKGVTGAQYLAAIETLHAYQRRMAVWWTSRDSGGQGFDILITPTIAQPPPPIGWLGDPSARRGWRVRMLMQFTSQFNGTGQPAISLPLHWTADGLPVGVQLVAAYGREDVLIRLASQIEAAAPWAHRKPPVHA